MAHIMDAIVTKKQAVNDKKQLTSLLGKKDKPTVRSSNNYTSLWSSIRNALKTFKIDIMPTSRKAHLKTRLRSENDSKTKT